MIRVPAIYLTVSILKRPRTPSTTPGMVEYQSADHEQLMKRLRPAPSVEE
ncbi:topless-related protein 3-like, partial [Trifolium medium]|nr:topless-related protein 3-like [Trifolium medium]